MTPVAAKKTPVMRRSMVIDRTLTSPDGSCPPRYTHLLNVVRSEKITTHTISRTLCAMSTQGCATMGRHTRWWQPAPSANPDPDWYVRRVRDKLKTPGYMESQWPRYVVMLRDNITNPAWLAQVAVSCAVHDVLCDMASSYIAWRKGL